MINEPSTEQLINIPRLYETESVPTEDKVVYAHFRLFDSHWYIIEADGVDTMFGYCILNGDLLNSEYGYVSLADLKQIKVLDMFQVEYDVLWKPKPAREVPLIRKGGGIYPDVASAPKRDPWTWYQLKS